MSSTTLEDNALRTIAHEAAVLADGEAVDAYVMLSVGVEAFLRGLPADEILAEARAAVSA
jgi:hypothetical protein